MIRKLVFLILISVTIAQQAWVIDREFINSELQRQFEALSDKDQSQFLEKRKNILSGLEATLNKARFIFGKA